MKKILLVLAVITLVLASSDCLLASSDEQGERHGYERSAHGGNYPGKFYGTLERMPEAGWEGIWIINGRDVLVTNATKIEEEHGRAAAGAYVEVKGNYSGKIFTAYEIEVKGESRYRDTPPGEKTTKGKFLDYAPHQERVFNSKFSGVIESMPQGGYEGVWIINGRKVKVNNKTLIDETEGSASVGTYAKVRGTRAADTITAYEIEIKNKK